MTPANNAQKIQDPEKGTLSAAAFLPNQILIQQQEKNPKSNNMKKLQHFCFSLLLLGFLAVTITAASKNSPRHSPAMSAEERLKLQELLNTIEPASLHEILHKHLKDKYKHGVYQEDKAAMEVVAQSDTEVAHSLIELAKRQAPNTTTTVVEAVTTTTTAVTTPNPPTTTTLVENPTTVVVEPPTTTQADQNPTTSAANPPTQPATSANGNTTPNQPPTSNQQKSQATTAGANPTSAAQNPGSTPSTAAGGGIATVTSRSTATATENKTANPTSGSSSNDKSSSDDTGSAPTSTSLVTQKTIYTTTSPNGSVQTITSVTVVPAGQAEHTGTTGATKTNGSPSLQTNGANSKAMGWNGVAGVIGLVVAGVL